jgi:subfamily B ATP-binding cassette protein MsbA
LYTLQTVVIITLGIFVAKNLSRYAALWILAPVRNGVVANFKQALHDKWLSMSFRQHQKLQKGDQLTRATADLTEIEWTMLKGMEGLVRDPLMILGTLILLFSMSPRLTLMAIAIIPISGGLIATIGKSLKKSAQAAQSQLGNTTSELEEALTNFPIIQSYVAQNRRAARFAHSVDLWRKFMINVYRKRDLSSPIAEVLGVGVLLAVLYLGGQEVLNGRSLTGGELVAFVVLFYQLIPAFKNLTNALYDIQKGNASAARIFEVLDEEEAKDGDLEVESGHWEQGLRFENATFAYEPGIPVINGLHLDLLPGKTTALVGPSGGGKSTLLHLLAGFDYPQTGALNLADVPLNSFKRDTYRKHTGWVPQQPLLFNDTIAANVSMSGTLDTSRLMHALEAAHCLEFAQEYLANETLIGEGGNQLSGGQRQRLSIARAFYADPSLLLLDEATAALDNESEARVQEALIALMKGRTTVVVAHRLSTVQHADQIAYVEAGRVVELGTHSELLQKAGKYAALVNLGTLNAEA